MDELTKSIDMLIADVMGEPVVKSIDIAKDADTKADAVKAPATQDDKSRGAGRPKDPSGEDANYDADITEKGKEEDQPEANQVKPMMKKSASADTVEITREEYETLLSLKKSIAAQEELKKAEEIKKSQEDLIKAEISTQFAELRKSMEDLATQNKAQADLIKSMSERPARPKSVTGVMQLEKSVNEEAVSTQKAVTQQDLLDAAESLFKSGKITQDHVTELEMTKTIYDREVRALIEREVNKR